MGIVASQVLERSGAGRVLSIFCDDVDLGCIRLRTAAEELESVPTLVALEWERAPSLARELDEIRDALAEAAVSLWPDWYITAEQRFDQARSPDTDPSTLAVEIAHASPNASASWLREAWQCCRVGTLPLVPRMASAEQVRQLSKALDPSRLVFVLSVVSADAAPARIRGLARAAEWLAREAQAKTLLLLPSAWRGHPELDHVAYGSLTLDADELTFDGSLSERPPGSGSAPTAGEAVLQRQSKSPGDAPVHVVVSPLAGKPHPASDVEQRVFKELASDPELSGLFESNQRLAAFGGKHYIVDLVWRQGRLIVELDGPEHHSHFTYVKDRDRDYRLFMSGYTTLRVANAEVYVDLNSVTAKIKNMVAFLKGTPERTAIDDP